MVRAFLREGIALKSKLSRLLVAGNFDHPPLPLDQLELAEPQQVLDMILALGGALPGKPGVLALEGGQLELPEMMLEQDLRRVAHRAVPEIRLM